MSMEEAEYCGLPILGIPLFPDQKLNVGNYVAQGAGISMSYDELNESSVATALNQLLNNYTYTENAGKLSELFKDRSIDPLQNAIYWLEYVVRHGDPMQMRSKAKDMSWFDYFFVDVIIILILVVFLSIPPFFYLFKVVQNYFDGHAYGTPNAQTDVNINKEKMGKQL